jgi:translocon-associated protein subunit alpha
VTETGSSNIHRITALNQTVSVVEPNMGWLDLPLLFLYLLIGTAAALTGYAIYEAYYLGPAKGRKGKGGKKVKAVVVAEPGKAYPDVKPYEEEWIPEQHLRNRASKTKKSANAIAGASSGGEDLTSAGEVTSGGETSGAEGLKKKKKGKK